MSVNQTKKMQPLRWHVGSFFRKYARWDFWTAFLAGPATKLSIAIPIVGYVIVFNDSVTDWLTFDRLTEQRIGLPWVTDHRLALLYYGLVFSGLGGLIYRARRPQPLSVAGRVFEYVEIGSTRFSPVQLSAVLMNLKKRGGQRTAEQIAGASLSAYQLGIQTTLDELPRIAWERLKRDDRQLLLTLLHLNFMYSNNSRPVSLYVCVVLAAIGYLALGLSSFDLFLAVTASQFF